MSTDDTPTQRLQRRALAIFDEIAELDPAAREARLQDLCAGEAELLMEVRSLLAADAGATEPFADAPRWGEALEIFYPKYVTWFDFPFTIWMGPETSAAEKNAALEFQRYLLSSEVQAKAVASGLRPVNAAVSVDQPNSPFTRWAEQGVVPIVSRTDAMRSPDRDVLLALLRWFDLNVGR